MHINLFRYYYSQLAEKEAEVYREVKWLVQDHKLLGERKFTPEPIVHYTSFLIKKEVIPKLRESVSFDHQIAVKGSSSSIIFQKPIYL